MELYWHHVHCQRYYKYHNRQCCKIAWLSWQMSWVHVNATATNRELCICHHQQCHSAMWISPAAPMHNYVNTMIISELHAHHCELHNARQPYYYQHCRVTQIPGPLSKDCVNTMSNVIELLTTSNNTVVSHEQQWQCHRFTWIQPPLLHLE